VRPDIFITCHHVINDSRDPHRAGDSYRLIANVTGSSPTSHAITTPQIGQELTLFSSLDLAVLRVNGINDQAYVAIAYDDIRVGAEVGVVGYPLASLITDVNGNLTLQGLIYRAAYGPVTGRYDGTLPTGETVPVVEVNFMFVPGNSGGPVFNVNTGRVCGMVQSIRWTRIAEQVMSTNLTGQIPLGVVNPYIVPIMAIYSWGIKLDCARTALEGFGVVP